MFSSVSVRNVLEEWHSQLGIALYRSIFFNLGKIGMVYTGWTLCVKNRKRCSFLFHQFPKLLKCATSIRICPFRINCRNPIHFPWHLCEVLSRCFTGFARGEVPVRMSNTHQWLSQNYITTEACSISGKRLDSDELQISCSSKQCRNSPQPISKPVKSIMWVSPRWISASKASGN